MSEKKYRIKRKWPEAIYPGSLLQQNHGEELTHGYYEWNLNDDQSEFVKIDNPYGYYTLHIEDGVIPVLPDVPDKPRFRLKVKNTNAAELKRVKTDLRRIYGVQEIIDNRVTSDSGDGGNVNVGDVSSISYQNNLIVDYVKRNFGVDDEMLSRVQSINKSLNQKLDEKELAKSIKWRPKKFKFSNLFSYGENNVVDFSKMNGIMGIFAENATGKSSLFGALCYCLFDKTPRAYRAVEILNTNKDWFECELKFEIDGVDYVVNRSGERKSSGRVPVDVNFYKIEDGKKISLNARTKPKTDNVIQRYVGEYSDFKMTTLSVQNDNTVFIDKSQSNRKDVLAKFIGIDVFEGLYNLAKEESRELKTLIKDFEEDDLSEEAAKAEEKYEEYLERYEEYQERESKLLDEKNEYMEEIMELNKSLIDIPDKDLDIRELEENLEKLNEEIDEKQSSLKQKKIKRDEKKQAKVGLEELIDDLDKDKLRSDYQEIKGFKEDIDNLRDEISILEDSLDKNKSAKEHLEEHSEFDPNCEYCVQRNEKDATKLEELKETIESESQKLQRKKNELEEKREKVESSKAIERWEKYEAIESKIEKHESFISKCDLKISRFENNLESLKSKKQSIESDIDLYYEIEDSLKHNQEINSKISSFEQKVSNIESEIENLRNKIKDVHGSIKVQENKKKNINEKIEKFQELSTKFEAYDYYLSAVKRDGIPYELIKRALPQIEEEVNNILSQIVDFSIVFDTDVDGKKINGWMVTGDEQLIPLDNASGMEGFVASLAIRVALTNISNLPHSNFLAVDEGFGVLDSDKRSSLMKVFDYFKTRFSFVLFVTHLESLRDISDNILEIRKEDGYSRVNFS